MSQHKETGHERFGAVCAKRPDRPDADPAVEPPLGKALFRVMRALMFEEPPVPELNVLPLAQLRLLWTVFYHPDATMKDYSEKLSVSQSTVTQLAERLIRRGLLERQADTHDRRVVRLHLNSLGQRLLDEANTRQRHTFAEVWDRLTPEERDVVIEGLNLLGRAGEAMRAAQGRPLESWPEGDPPHVEGHPEGGDATQPVVDLMARRVRGRTSER
jgi:DNA-binding MarR family transcriptional regulator